MACPGISANPSRRATPAPRQPRQPGPATRPASPLPLFAVRSPCAVKTSEGDGAEAFRGPKEKQSFFS